MVWAPCASMASPYSGQIRLRNAHAYRQIGFSGSALKDQKSKYYVRLEDS